MGRRVQAPRSRGLLQPPGRGVPTVRRSSSSRRSRRTRAASTLGVTVEGIPIELLVAEPGRFGTELLRATGTADYVNALGFLPAHAEETAADEMGIPWCPPSCAKSRSATSRRRSSSSPMFGVTRTATRPGPTGRRRCSRWQRPRAISATSISPSAITRNVRVVPGLDADDLRRQGEEIAEANERLAPFRVLRGTEVDIKGDGSLDLPDDILDELDWVQLSSRGPARGSRAADPQGHGGDAPSGGLMPKPSARANHQPPPPNALDLEQVFEVALETGVALETNGLPDRLDLSGPAYALRLRPASPSSPRRTRTPCRAWGTCSWRSRRHGEGGRGRRTSSTRSLWTRSCATSTTLDPRSDTLPALT